MRSYRRCIGTAAVLLLAAGLLTVGVWPPAGALSEEDIDAAVQPLIAGKEFDIARWEAEAVAAKIAANLRYPAPQLAGLDGSMIVMGYVEQLREYRRLQYEIEQAYARLPAGTPPGEEIRQKEVQAERLRGELRRRQPLVETILERQIARTAGRLGLSTAGVLWPPVLFRLSPPPTHLVVSPRDHIELIYSRDLSPDLPVSERDAVEREIDAKLGVSSLIEDLGGYGAYPPLILEEPALDWIIPTAAHEWIHNYLAFRPLGMRYEASPALKTLNETVASIAGEELGAAVIQEYYPWETPPEPSWKRPPQPPAEKKEEEREFDFARFMRETRQEAERLLAAGQVAQAEQYMESRRQELVARGYVIRKLNQAYFAFHGLYATGPGSIDPTGPKMEELRRRSPSLAAFMHTVEWFTAPEDLDRALGR
ncbi:MAG: hypothetical protein ACP5TV_04930 [Anaerolineae bacterium]